MIQLIDWHQLIILNYLLHVIFLQLDVFSSTLNSKNRLGSSTISINSPTEPNNNACSIAFVNESVSPLKSTNLSAAITSFV